MIDPSGSIAIETVRVNNAKFANKSPCPTTLLERLAYVVEILLSGMLP